VRPTSEISYDWKRGSLTLDAPSGVAFAGCFGVGRDPVRFANGLELKSARVVNPPGMPYPVSATENYLAFSAVATDGQPLATAHAVVISLGSTSFNTGFSLDPEQVAAGKPYVNMQGGTAPVLVARVSVELDPGPLRGMRYRMLDWQRREIGTGIIDGLTWTIPADLQIYLIECTR